MPPLPALTAGASYPLGAPDPGALDGRPIDGGVHVTKIYVVPAGTQGREASRGRRTDAAS